MKNKLMSSILFCVICVSCLVLFGCTGGGNYSKLRSQVPEEYLDEVIAWGPGITINISLYETDKPYYFFKYEDICDLEMISDEDLKKFKNSIVFTEKYIFTIYLGINNGEDVIMIGCHSLTPLLESKIEIFKSTLNFKFKDVISEMEELTGIEMTQEILNPKNFSRMAFRFSEELGDYEYYDLPAGINFNVLNDSQYTFDFIYVDDNSVEYHVYR